MSVMSRNSVLRVAGRVQRIVMRLPYSNRTHSHPALTALGARKCSPARSKADITSATAAGTSWAAVIHAYSRFISASHISVKCPVGECEHRRQDQPASNQADEKRLVMPPRKHT